MASNLPPGVSESMLPGSRLEDQIYDHLFDKLDLDPLVDTIAAGDLDLDDAAKAVNRFVRKFVKEI